jgi:hypothetical protein
MDIECYAPCIVLEAEEEKLFIFIFFWLGKRSLGVHRRRMECSVSFFIYCYTLERKGT